MSLLKKERHGNLAVLPVPPLYPISTSYLRPAAVCPTYRPYCAMSAANLNQEQKKDDAYEPLANLKHDQKKRANLSFFIHLDSMTSIQTPPRSVGFLDGTR